MGRLTVGSPSRPGGRAGSLFRGLGVATAAMLCACSGVRAPIPPAAAVSPPAAWRSDAQMQGEPSATWWRSFGDPDLARVVEQALVNNLDIAIAASRIEESRAGLASAQAQRLPDLDGEVGRVRQRDVNPAYGVAELQTATASALSLKFDTDLFGRLRASSAAARASLLSTRAAHAEIRLATAALAARDYLSLRALDSRLETLRQTLDARAQSLRIVQRRVATGYSSQLDLAQAEVDYRAAEALIPATELSISRTEDALSILLGENPHTITRRRGAIGVDALQVPATLPSTLLRRRPDLVAAEDQLVAADRRLDASRAAFIPDLQLSGSFGQVSSTLIAHNPIDIFSVGASILAPIFDSGRLKAQQTAVAAQRDQAAYAYRRATLKAFAEVEDALAATARIREELAALESERMSLRHSLVIATTRYRAGYSPFLDQLDAQRGLLSVELALAQARADLSIAYVTLYQALGGGWDVAALHDGPGAPAGRASNDGGSSTAFID